MSAQKISASFRGVLGTFALDASFEVPAHGIVALFGPSGCGKTTVLRCIAGLQHVPGRLSVDGEVWQDSAAGIFREPHRRRVGYVFQEPSLFPHMSVRDNLRYGERRAADVPASPGLDFDSVVDLLSIGHLLDRAATMLSGGERQRISVGRALLSRPQILLMDEPLSALDRLSKDEILPLFERLHAQLAIPALYVSHDLSEIERLADTMVLFQRGRVEAVGTLHDLVTDYHSPLLDRPQAAVVLEGRVAMRDAVYGLLALDVPGARLVVSGEALDGDVLRIRIAASDVSITRLHPQQTTIMNCLPARIAEIDAAPDRPQARLVLTLGADASGTRILSRITRKSLDALQLRIGDDIFAQIKSVSLVTARSAAREA